MSASKHQPNPGTGKVLTLQAGQSAPSRRADRSTDRETSVMPFGAVANAGAAAPLAVLPAGDRPMS